MYRRIEAFTKGPSSSADMAYLLRLMGEGKLLAEFLPAGPVYGYHNPWVRIYALPMPGEGGDSSEKKSGESGE